MIIVQKYGGVSVGTIEKILGIANATKELVSKNFQVILVASAMGSTTNNLIEMVNQIDAKPNKRELDQLLSTGEMQTVSLLSIALNNLGVNAISLSGGQVGIITNKNFNNAFINKIDVKNIRNYLKKYSVLVVAGFQGITKNGEITTLGRGGSDTTAVALAGALGCACEIFTDVAGIFTIDPKLSKSPKKLNQISYDELMEMSANGAKVMETRSVEIAKKYSVPLYIGKSLETEKGGTVVMKKIKNFEYMPIKNITVKDNISIVNIEFLQKNKHFVPLFFEILSKNSQKLEMVSLIEKNENQIFSFSVNENLLDDIIKNLNSFEFIDDIKISVSNKYCKVVLVGSGFSTHSLISKSVFEILNKNQIEFFNINISEIAIAFAVRGTDKQKTVDCLASLFNL